MPLTPRMSVTATNRIINSWPLENWHQLAKPATRWKFGWIMTGNCENLSKPSFPHPLQHCQWLLTASHHTHAAYHRWHYSSIQNCLQLVLLLSTRLMGLTLNVPICHLPWYFFATPLLLRPSLHLIARLLAFHKPVARLSTSFLLTSFSHSLLLLHSLCLLTFLL